MAQQVAAKKVLLTERVPTQLRHSRFFYELGGNVFRQRWVGASCWCVRKEFAKRCAKVSGTVLHHFFTQNSPKMGAGGCPETLKSAPGCPSAASDRIFIDFGPILGARGEPGEALGDLLSSLGRLRGTVGGIFEQLYGHFLAECFFAPFRSRKSSKKVVFGGARM